MPIPYITALPDAPSRSMAPAEFIAAANAFVGALPAFGDETNILSDYIETRANDAENSAIDSADSAATAEGHESAALGYANSAQSSANNAGAWSNLTGAKAPPLSVYHEGGFWQLLFPVADVALSEPGLSADWAPLSNSAANSAVLYQFFI